jgi:hypothetical protein
MTKVIRAIGEISTLKMVRTRLEIRDKQAIVGSALTVNAVEEPRVF